ncbi:MAG: hypothetical protein WA622_27100 [Mycobacterium sp.]|uniref:hypothetical protein n=1 Tax=Mycobacterium sp. TaxID=1785 RepID=UPI003C9E24BA
MIKNFGAVKTITTRKGWAYRVVEGSCTIDWFDGTQYVVFLAHGKESGVRERVAMLPDEIASVVEVAE